ncbi:MAG TPA: SUMF1/EgtB/PvdO family nonheme iron enzyme [Planctomycetota bacterium]|nr:SUMF1/EgtB/PvdO family nonheme iron enzyme [Planctomycetota bacterium]
MNSLTRFIIAGVFVAGAIGLNGCGGSGTGSSNGGLGGGVSGTRAPFQVLDLATGLSTAVASIGDLDTNPAYRTTRMAFKLVNVPSGYIGSASGAPGAALDPAAAAAGAPAFYLAAFETTQAQWQLIAGNTPWTTLASAQGVDDVRVGSDYPAVGVTLTAAQQAVQNFRAASGITLAVPSDLQWELACRAGGNGTYAWGNAVAPAATAAVVWETAGDVRGARQVGGRTPNSLGLYDLHGNVWELTSGAHLRGGSWNDPLVVGRAAHQADIDTDTAHLLVGVRFVLVP